MKTLDLKSLLIGILLTMLIVSFMVIISTGSTPRAWEYKKIVTPGIGIGPELNKLGDDGWEIVGYSFAKYPTPGHGNDESHFVLKRPKQTSWDWKFWKKFLK